MDDDDLMFTFDNDDEDIKPVKSTQKTTATNSTIAKAHSAAGTSAEKGASPPSSSFFASSVGAKKPVEITSLNEEEATPADQHGPSSAPINVNRPIGFYAEEETETETEKETGKTPMNAEAFFRQNFSHEDLDPRLRAQLHHIEEDKTTEMDISPSMLK